MDDAPPPDPLAEATEGLDPGARLCGNCLVWKALWRDDRDRWVCHCRLRPDRGDLPATAPACDRFLARGSEIPSAPPPEPGRRRRARTVGPRVRHPGSATSTPAATVPRAPRPDVDVDLGDLSDMTRNELIEIVREALDAGPLPELAGKWEGGTLVLKPGNDTQPKEMDLDALFKKVVRIRDQLRVLEQKINGHKTLSEAEKVELEAYITRCYGSLTSFNVLFRDERDRFHGSGG